MLKLQRGFVFYSLKTSQVGYSIDRCLM